MRTFLFGAVVLALVLSGCSEPAGGSFLPDDKNVWLRKAETEMQSRNYTGAAEFYEKALEQNPNSLSTHWNLAMLYEQHLNDFACAIYHYQRFIALKPEPERVKMANAFIGRAKYRLAADLANTPIEGAGDFKQLQDQNKSLQTEVEHLRQQLNEANIKLANQPQVVAQNPPASVEPPVMGVTPTARPRTTGALIASAGASLPKLNPQPAAPEMVAPPAGNEPAAADPAPVSPTAIKSAPKATNKTQRYVVKRGDTLASISERYYGTKGSYMKIYYANRSAIPDKNRLIAGTVLTIPPKSVR